MGEDRETTPDERLVQRDSFGELLARVTENVMGLTKIGFDVLDLAVRNLRIAGRADLTRLGRQLARNEDKLERVLQEVETLQEQVGTLEPSRRQDASSSNSASSRRRASGTRSRNGATSSSSGSRRKSSG
jgi:hypothetical protein